MLKTLFGLLVFFTIQAHGQSVFDPRLKNYSLKSQVEGSSERMLPQGETYTWASDIYIWKYWPDTTSLYHGPGFWAENFLEYRPFNNLSINTRLLIHNGSTSFGYNSTAAITPFFGITWTKELWGDWKTLIRFFDLDRDTLGAGLFFEDREISGLYLSLNNGTWFFDFKFPGTSVLNTGGDLYSVELYRQSSVNEVGFHLFLIDGYLAIEPDPSDPTVNLFNEYDLDLVSTFYFKSRKNSLMKYNIEAAYRQENWAYLAGLGVQNFENCRFCFQLYGQFRYYDNDIIERLGGQAKIDFVPYSLHVRNYLNAINIFKQQTRYVVYGANFDFRINLSDYVAIESLNEYANVDGEGLPKEDFYWYKHSLNYCPYKDKSRTCLKFYGANRVLNVDNLSGIDLDPLQKREIFKRVGIFGVEAVIYL